MIKELVEQRAEKQTEMEKLLAGAKEEKRAMSDDELKKFDELENSIKNIDATIKAEERSLALEPKQEEKPVNTNEERAISEARAFEAFIRGNEQRADFTKTANGAVIPETIANKIIDKIVELCPIYRDAERFNVKGTLQIPYYDDSSEDITVGYVTSEGAAGTPKAGAFKSIELKGYLINAISDVSKTLINNSNFDIVTFVINKMAKKFAEFIESELVNPIDAQNKVAGLTGATEIKTATAKIVTLDDLIELQEAIPDKYQGNAYWIMSGEQRKALRKIKDGEGRYILNQDVTTKWGYMLFGKPVYTSDKMPTIGTSSTTGSLGIYYGDMTGLAVKVSEDINVNVLREIKAPNHMDEIIGFAEFDSKVQDSQKIAKLVSK